MDFSDKTKSDKFPLNDSHNVSKDRTTRISRRKFVVVGGVAVGVIVGSTLYYLSPVLRSLADSLFKLGEKETATTTVTQPLTIQDLQWTPLRIVNSKVYDGRVSFSVENLDPSADQITLDFDSYYPPEIPQTAFTSEADRTYAFTGTGKKQTFSQDIGNLIGGRQYRALVTVKDKNGKETVNYADTPYVREFEKFAAKDVTVGVQYGTWWTYGAWRRSYPFSVTPILGNYDSRDMFVVNKQIDMLTGFGGNAFLSFLNDARSDSNTLSLFESPLIDDVSIGLVYDVPYRLLGKDHGNVNLNDTAVKNKFEADLKYLAQKYFARKNYFRIKGMPVLYLYHAGESFSGNVASVIKQVKESVRKETGFDIFLIGETVMFDSPSYTLVKPYDAVTRFGTFYNKDPSSEYPGGINNNEDNLRRLYQRWSSYAHQLGVHFIPTAMPGFISIRPSEKNNPVLPKSTKRFAEQLKIGMDFLDDDIRCLFVTTWNDYAENTNIEPTVQEGYGYLQTLRDTLAEQ